MPIKSGVIFLWLMILMPGLSIAQDQEPAMPSGEDVSTGIDKIWNLDVLGSVDFPGGDLAKRFGISYRIGAGVKIKTKKNWIFGAKFDFITGNKMRDDSLMINLKTNQGGVISQNGDLLNVGLFQRGYMVGLQFGKVFPVLAINPNSGLTTILSMGFMQYKINIFDRDNAFPQLRDEYKKGYDRLTNGLYIEDFLGYMFHAKNKLINFHAGLNFVWGFTQGRRDYLYDLARPDSGGRNDLMVGFKFGWTVPIYRKDAEETYY
jgi:hypothetical protein